MIKNIFRLSFVLSVSVIDLSAKSLIDCRVVTGGIKECNAYGTKLIKAKKISYEYDRQALIMEKNLPKPAKRERLKVISVADMIERYVKIKDSKRYIGSDISKIQTQKEIKKETKKSKDLLKEKNIKKPKEKAKVVYGIYIVKKGDVLSRIAQKFSMRYKDIQKINHLKNNSKLLIGQKLKLPFKQKILDALDSSKYFVEKGDTLGSIARKFKLKVDDILEYNSFKKDKLISIGDIIKLPLPYTLAQEKKRKQALEKKRKLEELKKLQNKILKKGYKRVSLGKRRRRVTATAYTSHRRQTDRTPFIGAWNNRLRPGMKSIAISRDLLRLHGIHNGTRVHISGLRGTYIVKDKMNKRFRNRIDIYMGLNRRRAFRWGRRSVIISW